LGVCGAATKHKVSKSRVSGWAAKAGVKRATGVDRSNRSARPRAAPATATADAGARKRGATKPAVVSEPPLPSLAQPAEPPPSRQTRVAKLYTPTQKARALEHALAHGVTAAAVQFGISRFSIYDWLRRSKKAAAGQGPAPTSGPAPQEIEAQRDREILSEWHKHPGLGPSQVVNQLRRAGIKVGVHTARRVMEDAGYRPPKVRREPHDQRYQAVRPNQMWHLDFVHRNINRSSTFTLILIDDCARYVVGHGVDDAERADMVIQTFEQAVERHGRPESVMHDKGSAFWSWRGISRFTALVTEMGIDQIPAEHKEWNGKVEVFNANLHKELFDVQRFHDLAEMRRRLAAHIEWYNHSRTNHALGGLLVPADRYYGRVNEVLARIEAGAGRSADDLLELRDRCLELFRVTSRGGVPEVWLLGKKLLGAPNAP
jgi:putative transposase